MNIGRARWIFENIDQTTCSANEKLEAIKIVSEMETHNAIKKTKFVAVIKWFLNCHRFSAYYCEDLYELCIRVHKEKPEVKCFNDYVTDLILKDLADN